MDWWRLWGLEEEVKEDWDLAKAYVCIIYFQETKGEKGHSDKYLDIDAGWCFLHAFWSSDPDVLLLVLILTLL